MKQELIDFLEHYGVKGMHWGIRNDKTKNKSSSDFNTTKKFRGRKTHQLSNRQLKLINERMNLEQNYRRLNPSKTQVGAHIAKGILGGLTTAASFYSLAQSPAGKAAIQAGKTFLTAAKIAKTVA